MGQCLPSELEGSLGTCLSLDAFIFAGHTSLGCPSTLFRFQQSMRENKEKQALSDLMIKPVQLIPRYESLVKVGMGLGGQVGMGLGGQEGMGAGWPGGQSLEVCEDAGAQWSPPSGAAGSG